ncbi:MAG: hypothetical protein AB1767_10265 [Bacillota bacterium]
MHNWVVAGFQAVPMHIYTMEHRVVMQRIYTTVIDYSIQRGKGLFLPANLSKLYH